MLTVRNIGHNSTHQNGINVDRPEGHERYLFLLVKSPAYFEFDKDFHKQKCLELNNISFNVDFPTDAYARHPGLIRQYVTAPAFILYTPGTPVYYYLDETYINDWIVFDGTDVDEFIASLNIPLNTLTVLSNHTELSTLIRELLKEFHQRGSHHELIMDARLRTIFYKYSDMYHLEIRLSDKLKRHRPLFCEVRNSIYANPLQKKTVSEIAEELNLSVSYFQHIYKELFGVSVIQDIIRSRIEKACHLLSIDQTSISAIAEICGYENVEHFSRQFKEITGFTPSQYKSI